MFPLGRPDVLAVGDLGIRRAVQRAYGLEDAARAAELDGARRALAPLPHGGLPAAVELAGQRPDVTAPPIRPPRRDELEALVAIEREAGALFTTVGMPEIAYDDPGTVPELEPFRAGGHAWVAVDADDRPIAYLISASSTAARTSSRSASPPPTPAAGSERPSSITSRRWRPPRAAPR